MIQIVFNWLAAYAFGSVVLSILALALLRFLVASSASERFFVAHSATVGSLLLALLLALMPGYVLFPIAPQTRTLVASNDPTGKHGPATLAKRVERAFDREQGENAARIPNEVAFGKLESLPSEFSVPIASTTQGSSRAVSPRDNVSLLQGLLVATWFIGFAVFTLRFLGFSVLAHRICKRASSEVPSALTAALSKAISKLKGKINPIRLLVTEEVPIPFTFGIFRPIIVMPAESETWPMSKILIVIQHELAHIQRRDVLLGWINQFACSLAWFNPMIWFLGYRCKVEREQACDDRVLNLGVPATDYGACLLEISESLSGKARNLRGAIAMTEPPLKRRLAVILSSAVNRSQLPLRSACLVVCVTVFATLVLSSVRPIGNAAIAVQPTQQSDKTSSAVENQQTPTKANSEAVGPILTEIPKQVFGRVTSPDGQPISGASLQLKWAQRIATPDDDAIETEDKQEWKVQSDANGDFSIDTSLIGKMHQGEWVQLWSLTADGFVLRRPIWLNPKDLAAGKRFDVKLLKGRKVKAQIVGNDRAPLRGAVIKAAGSNGDPNNGWWSYGDAVDAAGKCSIEVPVDMDIEWIVYGNGHAPKRVKVDRNESDLGTIQLEKGTRVYGKVIDEAGKPVSGTVVQITMHDGCELTSMAFGAEYATVTDENGMYTLIPFLGKCTVSTSSMGRDLSTLEEPAIKGNRGLVMRPLELNLDSTKDSIEVNLTQGPTALVKGRAKWDSGLPVVGMRIKGGAMFDPIGVELTNTKTDADGNYELRLPIPLEDAYVNAIGEKDAKGVFYMAHGDATGQTQYISFRPLEKDVIQANWTLKKFESPVPRPSNQSDGDKALEELRKQQSKMVQDLVKALEKAKSPQEQAELNQTLDPRNHFASKYLTMEEKYRGSNAALQALNDVMNNARSIGDETSAAALGRIEAVDRLIAYYLAHEQLGETFRALSGGPEVPRAYELVEAAYDQSPHSSVKVAALVAQIEWAKSQLRIAEHLEANKKSMGTLQEPLAAQQGQLEWVKTLQSIDSEKIRDETNKKLDILAKQYGSEQIHYYGNGLSAAASFRNAINNIVVGRAVSQIEALDVNNKMFRLSDQVGKVVLLLFAQDMSDNYATRYEPFREFIAKYKNKNVVVVGMMGNDKPEPLAAAAKQGHLPWNVIPQSLSSKFLRDWGVDALPSFYLIDQKGKLQGTYVVSANPMTGFSEIEEAIDKLLSESETHEK